MRYFSLLVLLILVGCRVNSPAREGHTGSDTAVVWDAAYAVYQENYSDFKKLVDPEEDRNGTQSFQDAYGQLRKTVRESQLTAWNITKKEEATEVYYYQKSDSSVSRTAKFEITITNKEGVTPVALVTVIYCPAIKQYKVRRIERPGNSREF